MVNCPNYAMDTHIYQAWFEAAKPEMFQEQACSAGAGLREFENAGVPIVSVIFTSMLWIRAFLKILFSSCTYLKKNLFSIVEFFYLCNSV